MEHTDFRSDIPTGTQIGTNVTVVWNSGDVKLLFLNYAEQADSNNEAQITFKLYFKQAQTGLKF
jgi:hypothetical protein